MKTKSNQGFTLVELIIVVAIIAVLASLAFMALSGETSQARDSKRIADLKTFEDSVSTSNGKNKPINYTTDNLGLKYGGTNRTTTDNLETNNGYFMAIRGAKLLPVASTLFESDVLPTATQDPKSAPYLAAFLSSTDYSFYATLENPSTKIPTALVKGSFKEGAILDVLTSNMSSSTSLLKVANPSRFIRGDIIKVDDEYMVVRGYNDNNKAKVIIVDRGYNPSAGGGDPSLGTGVVSHNKNASVKLFKSVKNGESLVCKGDSTQANLGTVTIASSPLVADYVGNHASLLTTIDSAGLATLINDGSVGADYSVQDGKVCQSGQAVTDGSTNIPYKVN